MSRIRPQGLSPALATATYRTAEQVRRGAQQTAWKSGATLPLTLPTYDGDHSVTHPDVVALDGLFGYEYAMGYTPYPGAGRENPSVCFSNDGITWEVPSGAPNPVVPLAEINTAGYLWGSDTDLIVDGATLHMYYRLYRDDGTPKERIYRKSTTDGVTWTAATTILTLDGDSDAILSPAVVRRSASSWFMWSVNNNTATATARIERRTSSDGLTWSAATACTIPSGFTAWHVDVVFSDGVYYALVISQNHGRLLLLTSTDGLSWVDSRTGASAVSASDRHVSRSGLPLFDGNNHYRSSLVPLGDGRFDVYVASRPVSERSGSLDTSNNPWRIGRIADVALPMAKYVEPVATSTMIQGQPSLIVPPAAIMGTTPSAAAWVGTNVAQFMRFSLSQYAVFRYVLLKLDQTGGRFQAGVVKFTSKNNWLRVMTTETNMSAAGSITPAAGDLRLDCGATELEPGDYAIFLWFNGTSAMVRQNNIGWLAGQHMVETVTVAGGVPSGGATTSYSNFAIAGIALEADI